MGTTPPDQPNEIYDARSVLTRRADCYKDLRSPGDRNVNLSRHMRPTSLMAPSVSAPPQEVTNFTSAVVSIQPEGAIQVSSKTPQEGTNVDFSVYMPGMHYERAAPSMADRESKLAPGLRTMAKGAKAVSIYLRPKSAPVEDNVISPLPAVAHLKRFTASEYHAQVQASAVPSVDDPISPLPIVTLRRASHIYHKKRPPSCRASRASLPPIITDFPRRESRQSIQPPLSAPSSVNSIHPPTTPQTPRDSPVEGEDSPCSIYSMKSLRRTSTYVQWDNTGYLTAEHSHDVWNEPSNLTTRDDLDGNSLKRQNTSVIKDLLRQRRHRAGLE